MQSIDRKKKTMNIVIKKANYRDPADASALVLLMDSYARDPMGGGKALPTEVKSCLAQSMALMPHAFTILAFADEKAAGLINCFEGFSTFACKPLLNIHDVIVLEEYRGLGISRLMLQAVETEAKERGCCKLTLEVLEGNTVAQQAYRSFGFDDYRLDPEKGRALFWQKELNHETPE
jgi:ribosomal protein S18 acetylase RimI-like enzyme